MTNPLPKSITASLNRGPLEHFLDREPWVAGQRQAFELALSDLPLVESLGVLVETTKAALGPGT